MAFPKSHIQDFRVQTDLDDKYLDAVLTVNLDFRGSGNVQLTLYDEGKIYVVVEKSGSVGQKSGKLSFSLPVNAPKKWTAETPALYHLAIRFGDQVIAHRVGFRKT